MKPVRQFFLVALLVFCLLCPATAQEKADQSAALGPTTVSQAKFPLTLQGAEYELLSIVLDFPPGARVASHSHGGHVLVTMLSGTLTLKEKGMEKTLKSGESWTENPGAEHEVVNSGVDTARVAVSVLLPKGAGLTTMTK